MSIPTNEDIKRWHDSGEELFKYGKEIMGLDPPYMICALCTATAKTLLSSLELKSSDELDKHMLILQATILLEMKRIGEEMVERRPQ